MNDYLKPGVDYRGGKAYPKLYETERAKDFKKMFGEKLNRDVQRQGWDIEETREGQWFTDVVFIMPRAGADSHNYFKILLDSMIGIVFIDDSNVQVRTPRVFIGDKTNQGFQIRVTKTENIGLFNNEKLYEDQLNKCVSCKFYRDGGCSILKAIKESRLKEEFDLKNQTCNKYTEKKGKK